MIKQLPTAAILGLLLSACAGGPPPPVDPTGTYDISISVAAEGFEMPGEMVIQGSAEEGYTGNLDMGGGGNALTNIVVDGQTLSFFLTGADAEVQVTFEGDRFSGELDEALLSGTKRKGA